MNFIRPIGNKFTTAICLAVICSSLLSACGGGSGGSDTTAGIGGTGIAVGKITGFGSVYVNDDRFVTDNSIFVVDGEVLNQSALAVGMVVGIEAETKNGEYSGDAIQVVYDDEIQGPIDSTVGITTSPDGTQKSFEVFGQTITIDDTSTRFVNISFTDFIGTLDDVVEISGFRISPTEVSATYVEKTSDLVIGTSEVELRGKIDIYMSVPAETFEIDGILIEVDRSDPDLELEVPNGILQDDLFVEVKGIIQGATTIQAKRIELEDEDLGEDVDDVRLQGIISVFVDISNFEIDGQLIDASGAEIEPQGAGFGEGTEVEVEGDIVGGVLIADELEVEDAEPELRSFISSVDVNNNRFEVDFPFTIGLSTVVVVNVNAQTVFEDETGVFVTPPFSLDDLVGGVGRTGDYVRVEGQDVGGEILASVVKRVDPDDKRKLEGVVEAYTPDSSITVLSIIYQLIPGTTQYDPFPPDIEVNDFVEIEDEDDPMGNLADGVADEVEEE